MLLSKIQVELSPLRLLAPLEYTCTNEVDKVGGWRKPQRRHFAAETYQLVKQADGSLLQSGYRQNQEICSCKMFYLSSVHSFQHVWTKSERTMPKGHWLVLETCLASTLCILFRTWPAGQFVPWRSDNLQHQLRSTKCVLMRCVCTFASPLVFFERSTWLFRRHVFAVV